MAIQPGTAAPDFSLPSSFGNTVRLRDLRGRHVVLAFYPGDWTPVCSGQIPAYSDIADDLAELNAVIFGVSVDSVASHKAWAHDRNLRIPLLADFEPKGAVSKLLGVYNEEHGTTERALIVIDKDGIVAWSYVSGYQQDPGASGILRVLEQLEFGTSSIRPKQLSIVQGLEHHLGDGPITLVEYVDLECPDCKAAESWVQQLRAEIPMRYILRHFPIRSSHPHSYMAAEAAEAAGAQGKFWEMVAKLFENQKKLQYHDIMRYGHELGLDLELFKRHLDNRAYSQKVRSHFMSGLKSGVTGTPTFFINGQLYEGEKTYDALRAALSGLGGSGSARAPVPA